MRTDTWIVLVCAFDFRVVIFQYCTSGFSSGQGPGGLARKRAASWCHSCSDGGLSKTWRCRDRVRSSMCHFCRRSMSNIPEYPQLWPRQGAVSRLVHANRARRGTAGYWSKVIEIYHVGIVFRGFSRWFEIFRNAVPDTAIAAWLNDCKFDASVPNAASCCSCLSACWSLFWSWCPNTMRCLSLTQTGFPANTKGVQTAELLTSQ